MLLEIKMKIFSNGQINFQEITINKNTLYYIVLDIKNFIGTRVKQGSSSQNKEVLNATLKRNYSWNIHNKNKKESKFFGNKDKKVEKKENEKPEEEVIKEPKLDLNILTVAEYNNKKNKK